MTAILLVHCREEMLVLPAVTAILLHHNAMDTWNDCNIVITVQRENVGSAAVTAVLLNPTITI